MEFWQEQTSVTLYSQKNVLFLVAHHESRSVLPSPFSYRSISSHEHRSPFLSEFSLTHLETIRKNHTMKHPFPVGIVYLGCRPPGFSLIFDASNASSSYVPWQLLWSETNHTLYPSFLGYLLSAIVDASSSCIRNFLAVQHPSCSFPYSRNSRACLQSCGCSFTAAENSSSVSRRYQLYS